MPTACEEMPASGLGNALLAKKRARLGANATPALKNSDLWARESPEVAFS